MLCLASLLKKLEEAVVRRANPSSVSALPFAPTWKGQLLQKKNISFSFPSTDWLLHDLCLASLKIQKLSQIPFNALWDYFVWYFTRQWGVQNFMEGLGRFLLSLAFEAFWAFLASTVRWFTTTRQKSYGNSWSAIAHNVKLSHDL